MKTILACLISLIISNMTTAAAYSSQAPAPQVTGQDPAYEEGYRAGFKAATEKASRKKGRKPPKRPKIWFAEMIMRVGESEDKILSHLKKRYVLVKRGKDWVVKSGKTGNVFGYVRFMDGNLTSVARVWASLSDPEAANMAGSLQNVLAGLTSSELKNLSIKTREIKKKEYSQKLVIFKMPHKKIRLSIYSGRKINRVEVQEIIF